MMKLAFINQAIIADNSLRPWSFLWISSSFDIHELEL